MPSFNTLALFKVPRLHYVSEVSQESSSQRLALYGWVQRMQNPFRDLPGFGQTDAETVDDLPS